MQAQQAQASSSFAILYNSRSPPTLLRLRMPYFLVLVSHVRTSQAYGCAYACAYRTSGNQALRFSLPSIIAADRFGNGKRFAQRGQKVIFCTAIGGFRSTLSVSVFLWSVGWRRNYV